MILFFKKLYLYIEVLTTLALLQTVEYFSGKSICGFKMMMPRRYEALLFLLQKTGNPCFVLNFI